MKKRSTYLTGYSVEQLLDIEPEDFFYLDATFQVEAVSRLSSAANKRLKRIEKAGLEEYSPAYQDVIKEGKFSVKGKNEQQLYQEFKRLNRFFRRSTSSTQGARAFKKEVEKIFKTTGATKESVYTSSDVFIKLMNRSREILPDATTTKNYQVIKDKAAEICERKAAWTAIEAEEALAEFSEWLEKRYREQQQNADDMKKYAEKAKKLLGY